MRWCVATAVMPFSLESGVVELLLAQRAKENLMYQLADIHTLAQQRDDHTPHRVQWGATWVTGWHRRRQPPTHAKVQSVGITTVQERQ